METANNLPELDQSEVDDIVESFKNVYQPSSSLLSARVYKMPNQTNRIIASKWSQHNLERGKPVKMMRYMLADSKLTSCSDIDIVDISQWLLDASSKSGKFRAVIRRALKDSSGIETEYLEIWSAHKLTATFDLNAIDVHGAVYTDVFFSSICWSPQEDRVMYIAEQKKPKTSSFYEQTSGNERSKDSTKTGQGEQYAYKESWGETLSSRSQPVIVSCKLTEKTISVVQGIPEGISPGQAIFTPNGDGIVGIGFINAPRRLGVFGSTNKKNHIFYLSHNEEYVILSNDKFTVHSPKFSPCGKYLVWFQRPQSGPTHTSNSIVRCDWSTKQVITIIDVIQDKIPIENGAEFFGFYRTIDIGWNFVSRCWTSDSKHLLFTTFHKYRCRTYVLNIENGKIWDISFKIEEESTILLDVTEDDYALLCISSYKRSPALSSLYIPSAIENNSGRFNFESLTKSDNIIDENIISNFTVSVENGTEEDCFATYYGRQNDQPKSTPLIVYLRGGPHWCIPNIFSPEFSFYVESGFGVLIVHFHGTLGFGEKFSQSLVGRMGSLDVKDCYNALQSALKKFPWLNENQVFVIGGSSGGFLAAHLISQYPNDFKGSVMRNPVTDIYLRFLLTDVPDWALVELGLPYTGLVDVVTNPKMHEKMIDASPVKNIRNVKAPTLLLLGRNDVRVPSPIGLTYYHMLKEMNAPTKVLFYEDGHQLRKVSVEMDCKINSIIWLKRCLKKLQLEDLSNQKII